MHFLHCCNQASRLRMLLLSSLILAATSHASDDERKGFVYGGGIGFAPYAHLSASFADTDFSAGNIGLPLSFIIGYGISSKDVLAVEFNAVTYQIDAYSGYGDPVLDHTIYQAVYGLSWYHYLREEVGKSFFVMGGIGASVARDRASGYYFCYGTCPDEPAYADVPQNTGVGFVAGIGQEISSRFQIALYAAVGFPKGGVYVPPDKYGSATSTAVHVNLMLLCLDF